MKKPYHIFPATFIILTAMVSWPGPLASQETKEYPLETLIQTALGNYRLIEIKKSEISQKEALSLHEKRWDNPEAGATLGGKKVGNESGLAYSVILTQKLPVSGKKGLASSIVKLEEKEARIALEEMKLALRYEITRLAYTYARDLMRVKHVRERLRRIKLINAYMQGHILVSPQRIVERNIVQAKLYQMEMEFLDISKNLKLSYNALNRYLKFTATDPFMVDLKWFTHAPQADLKELLALAEINNFNLKYQELAVAKAEKGMDLAKREMLPDIGLSLFYNADTMKEKEQIFGGGVTVPLPILSQNKHSVKKEVLNKKSQELASLHLKEVVTQKIIELHAEYEYAKGMIALFPITRLNALEEKMDYADAEFRKGRVSLATYLEMDSTLHENIESVYESQLSLVRIYTELLFTAAITKEITGDLP